MRDTISRKSLIDWINTRKAALEEAAKSHTGYHVRHLNGQHSALVDIGWEIQEGKFDIPSTESEGEAFWRTMYEQERDLAKGQKDHLRTENERLKAITELAVKGLKEIFELHGNVRTDGEAWEYIGEFNEAMKISRHAIMEIERLSHETN